jgi:hypothetical protein
LRFNPPRKGTALEIAEKVRTGQANSQSLAARLNSIALIQGMSFLRSLFSWAVND